MTDSLTGMMSKEQFLEHAGVKGMKWGVRKAANSVAGAVKTQVAAVKKDVALNRASAKKDRAERDASIDAARVRVKSGDIRKTNKEAKAQYKISKKEIGSREARKALAAVREKNLADQTLARQAKSGKESVVAVLKDIGTAYLTARLTM